MKNKTILIDICTGLLVLLFSYTTVSKMLEYDKFLFQMKRSPFPMMDIWAAILVWLVPLAEAVLVVLLLLPRWRRLGLKASIVLLGLFEVYISLMLLSGKDLPCSCGGVVSEMSWVAHLFFNAAFMLLAWLALQVIANKWPFRRHTPKTEYLSRPEA